MNLRLIGLKKVKLLLVAIIAAFFVIPERIYANIDRDTITVFAVSMILGVPMIVSAIKSYRAEDEKDKKDLLDKRNNYIANQKKVRARLGECIIQTNKILSYLPAKIKDAEACLDRAVLEFAEGAFTPFWDAIESSTKSIASYDADIQQIRCYLDEFRSVSKCLEYDIPELNINFESIASPSVTIDKISCMVRIAQKNFQFATIYEQRKTNLLLTEGFTSLAQALNDMSYKITSSIYDLSQTVYDLAEQNNNNSRELIAGVDAMRIQLKADSDARRDYERLELKMLDNIQRHKKPSLFT